MEIIRPGIELPLSGLFLDFPKRGPSVARRGFEQEERSPVQETRQSVRGQPPLQVEYDPRGRGLLNKVAERQRTAIKPEGAV